MPQDDGTQSNALEALQSHSNDEIKYASEWIMFAQLPKGVHKCMRCQEGGHGQPYPLFIATQANRAIIPLGLLYVGHRTGGGGTEQGVAVPPRASPWFSLFS